MLSKTRLCQELIALNKSHQRALARKVSLICRGRYNPSRHPVGRRERNERRALIQCRPNIKSGRVANLLNASITRGAKSADLGKSYTRPRIDVPWRDNRPSSIEPFNVIGGDLRTNGLNTTLTD